MVQMVKVDENLSIDLDELSKKEIKSYKKDDLVSFLVQLQSHNKIQLSDVGYQLVARSEDELKLAMMIINKDTRLPESGNLDFDLYDGIVVQLSNDGGVRLYAEKTTLRDTLNFGFDLVQFNSRRYLRENDIETMRQELNIKLSDWGDHYE